MSVVVYAPYADASTFYRLTEPARVTSTPVVERLNHVGSADTVVLNRPLDPGIAEQVRLWREEGRKVIVDLDDCFDTVSVNHAIHGKYTTESLHSACKAASVVTCSTPALVERYGYGHGVVLRNRIPGAMLETTRRVRHNPGLGEGQDGIWVGWYGSLASHPDDPAAAGYGIGRVLNPEPHAQFVYAGPESDARPLQHLLGLDYEVSCLGFHSMMGLPSVVAEFDIGVVPLDISPFNEAKSALKGLEMAAVGVPVIASPTSEYQRMAREGGCVTALGPDDWWGRLLDFVHDPAQRADRAASGKAWAATQTYERHAGDWRTVWYSGDHATL